MALPITSSEPLLTGTVEHLKSSAANATSYFNPSPKDLIMVVPRALSRVASFVFNTVPEAFEQFFAGENGGLIIAEATGEGAQQLAAASAGAAQGAIAGAGQAAAADTMGGSFRQVFSFQQIKSFGGMFGYMTSKWALGCFIVAIVLNRAQIYASARRHLELKWSIRLALRIMPIVLFFGHTLSLLQAMRCQTSPSYPDPKYVNNGTHVPALTDFSGDGGLLHHLSSTLLFWQAEEDSCLAVNMISTEQKPERIGSLSLLWPVFRSLCLSQFIETLSCAVQGRPVMTETGMSIFEHSLAFAEAEAMVYTRSTFSFGTSKMMAPTANVTQDDITSTVLKQSYRSNPNTPPEVLLMALISCLNNLSSQILGVFDMQSKFRLINTGIWGLCFMGSFVWGFMSFRSEQGLEAGIIRFPTVCIVGFIPHLLILDGIFLCTCIYSIALLLSILSPPRGVPRPRTWKERLRLAQNNMQANMHLSNIRLHMHEDFYTALIRVGFSVLTAANEAVFLNEGRRISIGQWTWLEEERMNEIEQSRAHATSLNSHASIRTSGGVDSVVAGVTVVEENETDGLLGSGQWRSGYARERTTKTLKDGFPGQNPRLGSDGVGALQRGNRYMMAFGFLKSLFYLVVGWIALALIKILDRLQIRRRPAWLRRMRSKTTPKLERASHPDQPNTLEFWLLSDEGILSLPENDDVDVEYHTKRRLELNANRWGVEEERQLDSNLYNWFTHGGWWGERDSSGDFQPSSTPNEKDDDTTSVISISSAASSADEHEWESDSSGARTPTQRSPNLVPSLRHSRETTPAMDLPLDVISLARLLQPTDSAERHDARILASHLAAERPLTRAQYRKLNDSANAHILTSTRYRPPEVRSAGKGGRLTAFEEAEVLEYLILKRRERGAESDGAGTGTDPSGRTRADSDDWRSGAEGLGAGGPQCVVCQSAPRTILAWPCRCLSLCEDCRVSLAMNNFATCVCCRQDVVGFSRLFVP